MNEVRTRAYKVYRVSPHQKHFNEHSCALKWSSFQKPNRRRTWNYAKEIYVHIHNYTTSTSATINEERNYWMITNLQIIRNELLGVYRIQKRYKLVGACAPSLAQCSSYEKNQLNTHTLISTDVLFCMSFSLSLMLHPSRTSTTDAKNPKDPSMPKYVNHLDIQTDISIFGDLCNWK